MIKWTGKSTDGRWNKTVEADSYFELLEKLVDKGYIGDYIDSDSQLFNELSYVSPIISDLQECLNDEEVAEEALEELEKMDWSELLRGLTDKEIEGAIRGCDSQAYYQEFEVI